MAAGNERLAEKLREQPPELDDVSRARMEKRLLDAVSSEVAAGRRQRTSSGMVARVDSTRPRGGSTRTRWIAGGAAVLAVAAAAGLVLWSGDEGAPVDDDSPASATFQSFVEGESVRRGAFAEGETVRTEQGQRVEVHLPDARVDVTPGSVARFERVRAREMRIALERGAVDVELHPSEPGEQQLAVTTPAARVEVVGTVFRVEVDAEGATTVRVEDGVVRVVPSDGSDERMVRGGSATRVEAPADGTPDRAGGEEPASNEAALASPASGAGETSGAAQPAGEREPDLADEAAEPGDPETEPEGESGPGEEPAARDAPALSVDARFDLARSYERRGRAAQARHVLYQIARSPVRRAHRVRAWHRLGDSFRREGDPRQAAEAYRRAAHLGRRTNDGFNALYALARLRERELGDASGAKAAYRQYIELADEARLHGRSSAGPNLHQARQALCRLGETSYCRER